ncbi:hypothetical protein CROQUDRAFT_670856 [Cronartium quercuum f. sp. fusiforme G11]|uniref:Uncharacterized protein n=1 Tax=Cronartium quercuum f. sp. fusiforme G11 TaxID=708437 RepID=A0A9P6TCN0_9BASI|nr:hypothetical protein CROQUDRAFT_670856 [Cronartium quercuum f. sp. fusiforme G11]
MNFKMRSFLTDILASYILCATFSCGVRSWFKLAKPGIQMTENTFVKAVLPDNKILVENKSNLKQIVHSWSGDSEKKAEPWELPPAESDGKSSFTQVQLGDKRLVPALNDDEPVFKSSTIPNDIKGDS